MVPRGPSCLAASSPPQGTENFTTAGNLRQIRHSGRLTNHPYPQHMSSGVSAGFPITQLRRTVFQGYRRRGTHGRYTDTEGSPSSQNRHGTVAPALTPTLGPVRIAFSSTARILVRSRSGDAGSQ